MEYGLTPQDCINVLQLCSVYFKFDKHLVERVKMKLQYKRDTLTALTDPEGVVRVGCPPPPFVSLGNYFFNLKRVQYI